MSFAPHVYWITVVKNLMWQGFPRKPTPHMLRTWIHADAGKFISSNVRIKVRRTRSVMSEEVLGEVYRSRVTSKGQLTLPKGLREAYHVHEGETVILLPVKGGILLKHSEDVGLSGLWRGLCTPEEAEKWVEELRSRWRVKSTSSTP